MVNVNSYYIKVFNLYFLVNMDLEYISIVICVVCSVEVYATSVFIKPNSVSIFNDMVCKNEVVLLDFGYVFHIDYDY